MAYMIEQRKILFWKNVLICINQLATFEVPSFTDSKDMIEGPKLKNGSRDP